MKTTKIIDSTINILAQYPVPYYYSIGAHSTNKAYYVGSLSSNHQHQTSGVKYDKIILSSNLQFSKLLKCGQSSGKYARSHSILKFSSETKLSLNKPGKINPCICYNNGQQSTHKQQLRLFFLSSR